MNGVPHGKSTASRWALWITLGVAAYVLSVGPMTALGHHLGINSSTWKVLHAIYRPMRYPAKYPPAFKIMSEYTAWWISITKAPHPLAPSLFYDVTDFAGCRQF